MTATRKPNGGQLMDREAMIGAVETLYKGRRTGDTSLFEKVLAPQASFRFVGEGSIIMEFPGGSDSEPEKVAQALFEQIDMLELKLISSTIEENRAALHWRAVLRAKGGAPFQQELFDLWEFNEAGLITAGHQFQDTAKIINELDDAGKARSSGGGGMDFGLGSS